MNIIEKSEIEEKDNIKEKANLEEVNNKKYQKVTDGEHQMHSEKFKEPLKIKETLATMSELEEDEHAYDTEVEETYRGGRDRGSGMVFLIIFAAIVIIGGGLYYFLFQNNDETNDLTTTAQFNTAVNTTYVDRNYDVPVSYPYSAPESEVELHGLSSELIAAPVPEEQSGIDESTTKVMTNKDTNPPVRNEGVTSPPVVNETKTVPQNVQTEIVPSKPREQVAQNVFKYNETYAVQVAAFKTKKDAENGAAKYIKSGYSTFIEQAVVRGNNWYRLRIGGFKTLGEAKEFQKSNK